MIKSRIVQRLVGLLILAVGVGFTIWSWQSAINEGRFSRKAVLLFPAFATLGLGILLFPIDVTRLQREHNVDKPTQFAHLPLSWKITAIVAFLVGIGNWIAISQF